MPDMIQFDYHYGQESEQYSFYRIPKLLFSGEEFQSICCEAKMLYGLLLDRMSVSRKNSWLDERNRVYIIFPIEEIKDVFSCHEQKACKLLKQLETCGLVEKKRMGLGRPNVLYVKSFIASGAQDCNNHSPEDNHPPTFSDAPQNPPDNPTGFPSDNPDIPDSQQEQPPLHDPGTVIIKTQDCENQSLELRKPQCSNTNLNYLNSSNNNLFHSFQEGGEDVTEWNREETHAEIQEFVKSQIEYDILSSRTEIDQDRLRELVCIMVEVLCSNARYLFVDGDMRPIEQVKERYRQIDSQVIQHVMDCLDENTTEVRKVKNYLRTCLYNAPVTMTTQIRMQVNHDMTK